jgi:uncharacterized protein YdhG (YjbR/CyaY superfamily)
VTARERFASHEHYIAVAAPQVQVILQRIQALVETAVPGATRCISYNLPAYKHEKTFFYFAVFKKHIGIYPPVRQDSALIRLLEPHRGEKGNLSFPLSEPIPYELIGRVAAALAKEYSGK